MKIKKWLKKVTPKYLLALRRKALYRESEKRFENICEKDIFDQIYNENLWGEPGVKAGSIYSGPGSHNEAYVEPYVSALAEYFGQFTSKPNVIDLGCGDFNVGSKIRGLFDRYTACDIVDKVISENKVKFADRNVEFLQLNILEDALPSVDVAIVREVLQHLSNEMIQKILKNIRGRYAYLVVSENISQSIEFIPNKDQCTGIFANRAQNCSGVVLTEPPFNLKVLEEKEICRVERVGEEIDLVTMIYKFA
jgi:hypothetical protein